MSITEKTELLVSENRLRETFKFLKEQALELRDSSLIDDINRAEQTYKYMIHYLVEGVADTGRGNMYAEIKEQLRNIAFLIERKLLSKNDSREYYSSLRVCSLQKKTLIQELNDYIKAYSTCALGDATGEYNKEIHIAEEKALQNLFIIIWVSTLLTEPEYKSLLSAFRSEDIPSYAKAQIISALLLGCLEFFDKRKMELLLDIYEDEATPEPLAARAMVAVLLILSRHAKRIENMPKLRLRLETWNDSILTYQRLRVAVMAIVKTFDTDRINTKMKEEVIPEIMKLRPELMKRFNNLKKDTDLTDLEENPEWDDLMNKTGLSSKLKEMQEIQMEGGDVMMLAFSNLKNFPFFNAVPNWFLPFYKEYSELSAYRQLSDKSLSILMSEDAMICNSDRFSFGMAMNMMPDEQKNQLISQFELQNEQFGEEMKEMLLKSSQAKFDMAVTKYLRDLYRFFRLYRKKDDYYDPFAKPFNFASLPVIGTDLADDDTLRLIGEFYFRHGYYSEAFDQFTKISTYLSDGSLLEKCGYCLQYKGDMENALDYYRKAELLNPKSKWLQKKLAFMLRSTGNYEEAERYYRSLLSEDSDNVKLNVTLGQCLMQLNRMDEALKCFYKVNYLDPENTNAIRALAWCELLTGHTDKSKNYYTNLLLTDPIAADYLNAGHCSLVKKDYNGAISLYKEALKMCDDGWKGFMKDMQEDYPILASLGVDISEMPILIDKMKYDLE